MTAKFVRTPSLKRGREEVPVANRVKLERVLGLTVASNSALCCDPNTENILYTAGCTVVSFCPRKNKQTHILNTSRKTVTCIAVTGDGHHLATGECGHMPSVRVWDIPSGTQLTELSGHQYGINCVAFSPNGKHLVSIGSQHDMIVNVWEWKTNIKVASNKVSTKVKAVSFAEDGKYFVTVGMRHVKFWYLEYSRSGKFQDAVPLMGRAGIMGELRDKDFCDVACGRGMMAKSTFTITKSGQLCEVNSRRMLDKWVELRTQSANCMSLGWNFIFVGCADGIVRCFNPMTLQFITTLPRTHYLGFDISQGFNISHMVQHPSNAKYPDTIAVTFDDTNMKLTCIYNDHSIYIWDVHDIKRVGKTYSFLYHSGCIWGVDIYPLLDISLPCAMPSGSFITCSSDDTIRVWNLEASLSAHPHYQKNIYSDDLLKIVYIDPTLSFIKNQDLSDNLEKSDTSTTYDSRNGVRSLCISPDGQHLASGDRMGNIRIHDLNNMQELCLIEAHDAEVLTLQYSKPESGYRLLASASRDRLLHMFNVEKDYSFAEAFDGHSSSITAVKFITAKDPLQVVSCGADKSIIFRHLVPVSDDTIHFARGHIVACKTTLYDMELDSSQKSILTACQDRNVRVYNVNTGRQKKTFRGSVSEDGSLIKLALDNSGIYLATSCTDKTLCIYDYYSGECMATMMGHSELVTGLKFTNDCRRLISASGDGCIFVWQIPHDMVVTMQARLSQQAARSKKLLQQSEENLLQDLKDVPLSPQDTIDILSSTSPTPLPTWASRHESHSLLVTNTRQQHNLPGGRWAQRLAAMQDKKYDVPSIMLKTFDFQDRRLDSDGSKDSSLDSGTELRNYPDKDDLKRGLESVSHKGQKDSEDSEFPRARHLTDDSSLGSYKYEDMESTEHDGDVEDISEAELESTEQECGPLPLRVYYPPPIESGSDFTVNAMDVEELKRSMRNHKKSHFPEVPVISVPTSVSGSQDSDDDDEDASTPSGETTERSLHSASASMENIDFLVQREKFLKNTFESLGGADMDAKQLVKSPGGTSITSKFLGQASLGQQENKTRQSSSWKNFAPTRAPPSSPRNNVILPKKPSGSHIGMDDKRNLLKRRLEEMRQQLESVGYTRRGAQSSTAAKPLRNSVSVADLMDIDSRRDSSNIQQDFTSAAESDEEFGGMRRTYSLSDLRPSVWEESEDTQQLDSPFIKQQRRDDPKRHMYLSKNAPETLNPSIIKRPMTRPIGTSSNSGSLSRESRLSSSLNRSVSMGELNQSDSNGGAVPVQNRLNSLMRPTISSRNKVVSVSKNAVGPPVVMRHGLTTSHSSVNLSRIDNEESSSEEIMGSGRSRLHVHNLDRSASANNINTAAFRSASGFKMNTNVSQGRPSSSRLVSSGARPKQAARPHHVPEHEKLQYNLTVCIDLAKKLKDLTQQVNDLLNQIRSQPGVTECGQKADVLLEALHTSMFTMMTGEFLGLEITSSQEKDTDCWIQYLREQLAVAVSAYLNRTATRQGHLERVIEDVSNKLLEVLIDETKTMC